MENVLRKGAGSGGLRPRGKPAFQARAVLHCTDPVNVTSSGYRNKWNCHPGFPEELLVECHSPLFTSFIKPIHPAICGA